MPRLVPEGEEPKSPPRKPIGAWEKEARRVLNLEMLRADLTPETLAKLLKERGYGAPSVKALALRISRGTFSFGFTLQALKAMGVQSLDISHVKDHRRSTKGR